MIAYFTSTVARFFIAEDITQTPIAQGAVAPLQSHFYPPERLPLSNTQLP
jgi:hypothetical protein